MDSFCGVLETAVVKLNTTVSISERKQCEEVVLRFRNASHPYELCRHLLSTSRNSQVLYEVGKCLSKAVVREWSTVLCPNGGQLSANGMTESMPYQLLCYLLQWVASCGNEIASFARQSILGAVASIVKRAAAAQAQFSLSKSPLHMRHAASTQISSSFDNSASPSPLVSFFLQELSSLLTPIPVTSSYQEEFPRLSFGLSIVSAFLDEMSNVDQDTAGLNLPLEAHVHMQARFQAFELLQIFQFLLRLVESLLCSRDWPTENVENDETTYRLVHCLEIITSWNFLPEHVVDFTCLRPMARRNSGFRPSESWACVVGVDAISATLSLFLKLHFRLRSISTYCTRILSSIVALASLNGPLVINTHGISSVSPFSCPLAEHASICMSGLARALVSPQYHPLAKVRALLLPSPIELATSPQIQIGGGVDFASPYSRTSEIEAAFQPVASANSGSTMGGFLSYELPLLAELSVNLLRRLVEVCGVVEGFAMGNGWPSPDAPESQETVLAHLVFYLNAVNAFLGLVKTILLECLLLEANVVGSEESTADLGDTIRAAHEASERIFAYLSDVSGVVPHFNASNTAISYTTGPSASLDQMVCALKQTVGQVRANFQRHQHDLIRVYFASHLAAPVGFRRDTLTTKGASGDDEELDLELDEDDQIAYEDSLFAIGQFSSSSDGEALADIVEVLAGLLEERVWLLRQRAEAQPSFSLLEDLHWLLLFIGHVLITGPSKIGSSKGTQPAWDSNFSIPFAVWSIGPRSFTVKQFDNCRNYLIKAVENTPCDETDGVPPLLRLFGTLFRLLRTQVSSRVGSAQLTEDILWVFVRLTLTYFSCNHFAGPEGHLDPDDITSEGEVSLFKALLCPPTNSGGSGGAAARSANHQLLLTHAPTALTLSARLAMATWSGEPKVAAFASALLAAIARHSLFTDLNSKQEESNSTSPSPAQAWIELCNLVCAVETWACLETETLVELVDSCTRGCWCLRGTHRASLTSSDIFYQFVEELRTRLTRLIIVDGGDGGGDGEVDGQLMDPSLISHLIAGLSALRGLTRAVRWIVAHGGNSVSGITSSNPSAVAATSSSDTDLVGFLWTSIILPILQNCYSYFLKCYHMYHEVMVAVLTLFEEVADNCLLYLTNWPVTLTFEDAASAFRLTNGLQLRFPLPHTGSTQFFILTVILCAQYAQIHSTKITTKSISKEADEERVAELCHLFSLLQFFLAHEFELRLYGVTGTGLDSSLPGAGDDEVGMMTTVDVTLICVGFLLPLLTQSLLAVPELASCFYHLLSYALELRPEGLLHLTKDKAAETLSELGRLLRHGIFNLADATVNISALEALTYLAEFCAARGSQPSSTVPATTTTVMVTHLPLGKDLLRELLGLVTRDVFPTQLEDSLSGCIFALATLDPRSFEEVATESLARCSDDATSQQRLQHAFIELSTPLTNTAAMPERKRRNDFQHRFHLFVPTKGFSDYAVAAQILLSTQPCDRSFHVPPPTSHSIHHSPVFYSCASPLHTPNTPFGSLPCLRVGILPNTSELMPTITRTHLLLGPSASLVLCITLHGVPPNASPHLETVFPRMSFTSTFNAAKQCLFVVISTPRSFEDIHLQISVADWVMHLPIPVDLENVQPMDEVDGEELDHEILAITHPWKFKSKLSGKETELEDRLSRLFRCRITLGKWFVATRGLFAGCRVRLSRDAANNLELEVMTCRRELYRLLLDCLNRDGLLATEQEGERNAGRGLEALNDLRDALLTELGLFKSALCAPLIRRVLTSRVPLVTASTAIPPSMSALKVSDLVADWRNAAAGSEPIDQSVAADVLGGNLKVLAAACRTTESIITDLAK